MEGIKISHISPASHMYNFPLLPVFLGFLFEAGSCSVAQAEVQQHDHCCSLICLYHMFIVGWVWLLLPVLPAFWEAEVAAQP